MNVATLDTPVAIGMHVSDRQDGRYLGVITKSLDNYSGTDLPVFVVTCVDRRRRRFYGDELEPAEPPS